MKIKHCLKSVISSVLCISMVFSNISATSLYTDINNANSVSLSVASNLTYKENLTTTSSGAFKQSYMFEYTPGGTVTPVVAYGDTIYNRTDMAQVVSSMQAQGKTILGGINADFFSMSSGVPEGLTVTEGVLRSSDSYQTAVGIRGDGSFFIGKPQLQMSLISDKGYTVPVTYINKVRTSHGVYLLNSDYRDETGFTKSGTSIILRKLDNNDISIGGTVLMRVESISQGSTTFKIPDGCMVLTVSDDGPIDKIAQVKVGDTLTLSITSNDSRWNDVQYAFGGGDILIENGVVAQGLAAGNKPRTALGIRQDGSVVTLVVDGGNENYSSGISISSIASELLSMGCINAINLDGGGSTMLGITYPGNSDYELASEPSGGSPRACSTYLFFINTAQRSGTPQHLYLYPYQTAIMAGASTAFSVKAVDSGYYPANINSAPSFSTTAGYFSGNVLTADVAGTFDVFATCQSMTASGKVTVIDDTNRITVARKDSSGNLTSLSLSPGEVVDLDASAYYLNQKAIGNDNLFTWSVNGSIGSITADGVFTAGSVKGLTGDISVTFGTKTITIPVTVGRAPSVIDTFDELTCWVNNNATQVSDYTSVKYGTGAMAITYNFDNAQLSDNNEKYVEILASDTVSLPNYPDFLNIWIYSDKSGNDVSIRVVDAEGLSHVSELRHKLNNSGWQLVSFPLPVSTTKLDGIIITDGGSSTNGRIIVDQMVASYSEPITEHSQLDVSFLSVDVTSLVASVTDKTGNLVNTSNIELAIDGKATPFTYDMSTGLLTAAYSLDESNHRITIIASDSCGNINRTSHDIDAITPTTSIFEDADSHWGKKYIDFLSNDGVITGMNDQGVPVFRPDKQTTRAEMAVIMSRYLCLDTADFENVKLPFADTDKIPTWAIPHVKAIYNAGLMSGTTVNGILNFNPNANITRMEALTILGRTLPQGYPMATLDYKDKGEILSWALPHFEKLVSMEVVGGYPDATIKPNNSITRAEVSALLYRLY